MNMTRMALVLLGGVLIIAALAVLYYQTDLRNQVPEGAAIAVLLAVTGLFAIGLSSEFRRARRIEHVEHHETTAARPARPVGYRRTHDVEESETRDVITRRD